MRPYLKIFEGVRIVKNLRCHLMMGVTYAALSSAVLLSVPVKAQAQGADEFATGFAMPQAAVNQPTAQRGLAGGSFGSTIPAFRPDGDLANQPPQTLTPQAAPAQISPIMLQQAEDQLSQPLTTLPAASMTSSQNVDAVRAIPPAPPTQSTPQTTTPMMAMPNVQPMGTGSVVDQMMVTPEPRTTSSNRGVPYPQIVPQPGLIYEVEKIERVGSETLITRKIGEMTNDLSTLQNAVATAKRQLENVRYNSEIQTADYFGLVAAITARLQAGTTPGNPRLVNSWNIAQERLDKLSSNVADLNKLATAVSAQANMANFLLDAVRATYGLSGALESDHADLTVLEDDVTTTVVQINRLMNEIADDVNRRTAYLATERKNLQILALGVTNGELYGRSISNNFFTPVADPMSDSGRARIQAEGQKPLAVIRFNRNNVNYQQPVYAAMSRVIEGQPTAAFEIVAVSPDTGNPAQRALASTEARRKAEDVMRTLSNMGIAMDRVRISAASSRDIDNSEVHIFTR